jgi:hypothetical protein
VVQAEVIDTYQKERYSSGAPEAILRELADDYDLVITGMAA